MSSLHTLQNCCRPKQTRIRVGRGLGSGKGKTCGRGEKGASSRSGYKRRYGYEGGQFRTFMKLPQRGFNNTRFRTEYEVVNLDQIELVFEAGDVVNVDTLRERGLINGCKRTRIKLLGDGHLTKKITVEVDAVSETAKHKLLKSHSHLKMPK